MWSWAGAGAGGLGEGRGGVGTWEGPNWELADHGAVQTKRQRKLGNSCLLLALIQNQTLDNQSCSKILYMIHMR